MPVVRRLLYALGSAGWQITGQIVVAIGIYYYLPPEGSGLVPQVNEAILFAGLTAYGLARMIGGIVDSLADPFVGHYSDVSRSPLGRRRSFLVYGIVPMVAAPVALFWPLGEPGSSQTFVFLTVVLAVYYIFFTVYVGPYLALIPEIAWDRDERVGLSRLLGATGAPIAGAFGPGWLAGVAFARDAGLGAEEAIRLVVVVASVAAFVLCLLPIFAVDEHRYARSTPSSLPMRDALATTLRNRPFMVYLAAQVLFILGVTMIAPVLPYLSIVLLGRDEGFAALLSLSMVPGIVLGFVLVGRLVERIGPRNTLITSVAMLGASLYLLGLIRPDGPGGPRDATNLALVIAALAGAGLPMAGFMVLPNVVLAELIDLDEARTGANRSAMYYGTQGLLTKWAYAASAAIMSFLFVRYGKSPDVPWGVVLLGPVAATFCLASAAIYLLYPEREVLRQLSAIRDESAAREVDQTA